MQERPENLNAVDEGSEATMVTPRFDAEEASRAHPVVPLAEASPRANLFNRRARRGRGLRRSWPPALLAVALLAVAAAGGALATKVLRRAPANPAATQEPAAAIAPTQAAEAPAQPETPPASEAPREVEGAKSHTPAPRATRDDAEDSKGEDEGRRDKGHGKRRARDDDDGDGDKEMRRVLKSAKKKVPRLVDVLTRP
jgi:hypothetical protein